MGQASRHERASSKLREKLLEDETDLIEKLKEVNRRVKLLDELDALAEEERPAAAISEEAPPT